jgi:ribosomal protein S19E (S16A)
MVGEYKTEELKAVWKALLKVYGAEQKGCTVGEVAAATGLSEEVARACLEYLKQDGKVEQAGDIYAPNPKYVRDVAITHVAREVYKYLDGRRKGGTVDEIIAGIENEGGGKIKRELVEQALHHLEREGKVVFILSRQKWVTEHTLNSI